MNANVGWAAREAFDCSNLTMRLATAKDIHLDGFSMGVAWADSRRESPEPIADGETTIRGTIRITGDGDTITLNGVEYVRLVRAADAPKHGLAPEPALAPPTSGDVGQEGTGESLEEVGSSNAR
jgi:hypothetical protein